MELEKNSPAVKNKNLSFKNPSGVGNCRVQQCFLNTDLRFQIDGLVGLCSENGIEVSDLGPGEMIVFINTAKTQIKVLAGNHSRLPILGVYKMAAGRIYDLRVIGAIPEAFRAKGVVDLDFALRKVLTNHLDRGRGVKSVDA